MRVQPTNTVGSILAACAQRPELADYVTAVYQHKHKGSNKRLMLAASDLRLKLGTQQLKDSHTLGYCGIPNEANLQVLLRLRGGSPKGIMGSHKITKAEKVGVMRTRLHAAMLAPQTDTCAGVLAQLDREDYFKHTIEGETANQLQLQGQLHAACEEMDKSSVANMVEKVAPIMIPALAEWKRAKVNIDNSINVTEQAFAMKFTDEFMGKQQVNFNNFYKLFYPAQAEDDDEDMDL
jgi:hypothetical protein